MRFAEPFSAGWGAVRRSKRLVAVSALTTALVALPFAVWFGRQVDAVAARRPDATEVARALDPDMFADVLQASPAFDDDATALVYAALLVMFAVRPLVWGGYAGIAASRQRLRFPRFVLEGGSSYWKFLRISLVGVVLLVGLSLAVTPLLGTLRDFAEAAPSEDLARSRVWTLCIAGFLALAVVPMLLDYTRVGIRMHRRPGVLAEIGRSALFIVQHPFRTAGFFVSGLLLEWVVCLPLFWLLRVADGAYVSTSVVVLVLAQVQVAVREACRLFHLAGAWRIREAEELPGPAPPPQADGRDLLDESLPWHAR